MNFSSLFKKKKQKKSRNKLQLEVTQSKNTLKISGTFKQPEYYAKELWIVAKEDYEQFKVAEITPTNTFEFSISLDDLLQQLTKEYDKGIFLWYIKIKRPYMPGSDDENILNKDYELVEEEGRKFVEYLIRLGRFQQTRIQGLTYYTKYNQYFIMYITEKGNLSIKLNEELISPVKLQIDRVKRRGSLFKLDGKIFTKSSKIEKAYVHLKGRESKQEYRLHSLNIQSQDELTERKYGLNRYYYSAEIDFAQVGNNSLLDDDVYDVYLGVKFYESNEERLIRVGRPTFRAKLQLTDLSAKNSVEGIIIHPYFTFKAANLSFEIYKFDLESYLYLQKNMRWSWLIRLLNKNKDVWLVGERTYKAQDTGYAFFKYMRKKHPDHKVFYVIDKNSPEYENVKTLGNVLNYKSREHIKYSLIAKKVISSHHPDYLYPIRTEKFKNKVKADKVFLQHGIMGTKNMVANYGKNATSGFTTDFFIVSSDFEKAMIVNDFGYHPKEVFVTGLSRFDTLFAEDVEWKRQILIIPTWRDWIVNDEAFFESEYYERYKRLIHHEQLQKMAKQYNLEIVFCLHPNMQRYTNYFEHPSVRIINQGEVDVQHLIKESALMLTDYSSVGFDFSFLHKPVIYYQFDRDRFIGKRPSHLDLDNDLPGEICFEENEVIELLHSYCENNFQMKPEYVKRANKFIKYRDRNACKRIYHVVRNNTAKKPLIYSSKVDLLVTGVFNKFRKSRYYFPTMKMLYNIGRKVIKPDKNLILFESGLGKQYADSPRYIYEEIVKRGLKYKKVWVYNKQHRFMDPNTIRIKRLSPQYYYYLLKAGYWVNNQNFPTYIKKPRKTRYLQTWHGTPLKRMLFDLEEVYGRDDGYKERVSSAVENWDYLISPSPYATKAFRSAFRFKKEVLELGYPRNDIFYRPEKEDIINKVRNKLRIPEDKKVILYAPTFRDNQTTKDNKFTFEIKMDLERMKEQLGDEYVVLLRLHVVVSSKLRIDESLTDFAKNVSGYPDIQELLLISDILITDYSSVMFDFANTGNPMLFFTYDLADYRDNLRGFYMDFEEEAPGPLVINTDEIIENINNIDDIKMKYNKKYKAFQEKYCPLEDGNASKRVVDRLFNK